MRLSVSDDGGVFIYSIRKASAPLQLWTHYYSLCEAVYPIGNFLFIADHHTLRAFDISLPSSPVEVASISVDRRITDIYVRDSLAFLSVFSNGYEEDNGMIIVSISSLQEMREIARAYTPGWSNAIHANTRFVVLSDHLDGVYVYDYSGLATGIRDVAVSHVSRGFELFQNYPNPFNPTTNISFSIPFAAHVTLRVYDVLGREVAALANEVRSGGRHASTWDAAGLASGTYFCRLEVDDYIAARKVMLVR